MLPLKGVVQLPHTCGNELVRATDRIRKERGQGHQATVGTRFPQQNEGNPARALASVWVRGVGGTHPGGTHPLGKRRPGSPVLAAYRTPQQQWAGSTTMVGPHQHHATRPSNADPPGNDLLSVARKGEQPSALCFLRDTVALAPQPQAATGRGTQLATRPSPAHVHRFPTRWQTTATSPLHSQEAERLQGSWVIRRG